MREEVNQAKLRFEIPNFSKVVANTTKGHRISSNQFDVGGSKFVLDIYPNGQWQAKRGMFSASLQNENTHDVVVDCTISVEGGNALSSKNVKIEKNKGWGWNDFMRASEVKTCLEIVVDVKLKWENIFGGVVHQNQANSKELVQVEKRLGEKLEQMGGKLEQNMGEKLDQMRGKLEQNMRRKLEQTMGGKLEQMEKRMKTFVQEEIAVGKANPIPECPVCFQELKPRRRLCSA